MNTAMKALTVNALPLEPLAVFIVALVISQVCYLVEVVAREGGGRWTLALALALYSISSGVAGLGHIICRDRTVVDFSLPFVGKAAAYLRTVLTSLPHFVLLFVLDRGYRPAL